VTTEERQLILDEDCFGLVFLVWMAMMGAVFATIPDQAGAAHHRGPPTAIFFVFGLFALLGVAYGTLEIIYGASAAA
jgi:hypothetical protein